MPMEFPDLVEAGRLVKTQGHEGLVVFRPGPGLAPLPRELSYLFIALEGKPVPFFILEREDRGTGSSLFRLADVESEAQARSLCNHPVYFPLKPLPNEAAEESLDEVLTGQKPSTGLEGFSAYDQTGKLLGIIRSIVDIPGNPLFSVKEGRKEILIPASKAFIARISRKNRQIHFRLPDGFLELYGL